MKCLAVAAVAHSRSRRQRPAAWVPDKSFARIAPRDVRAKRAQRLAVTRDICMAPWLP